MAALVVFDKSVSRLERVHRGSGRPDSSIEIQAAQLMGRRSGSRHGTDLQLPRGPADVAIRDATFSKTQRMSSDC
ncbi:hypothetical protein [Streptomyces sp. NPDC052015]|uniref:hypothetical protein n=1 Tax=Streptomyces sp. NPDC052015 TaxID=3154755 RepID=UPI00341BAFEB